MKARLCYPILLSILLLPPAGHALQKKLKPFVYTQGDLPAEESQPEEEIAQIEDLESDANRESEAGPFKKNPFVKKWYSETERESDELPSMTEEKLAMGKKFEPKCKAIKGHPFEKKEPVLAAQPENAKAGIESPDAITKSKFKRKNSDPQFISEAVAETEEVAQANEPGQEPCEVVCCLPEPRWYLHFQPGYYYFTDHLMREFFDKGGFTGRIELGYQVWKPLYIWLDGGYFQKKGKAIGGPEHVHIKLATITLGCKTIFSLSDWISLYVGGGPRVFLLMMHNGSEFVRGDDNAIGVGGGFDAGFWILPFPNKNFFFNLFADYSWKKLKIEEDEISSTDHDIDVSGLTAGAGIGFRF